MPVIDLLASRLFNQIAKHFCLETRTTQFSYRCNATGIGQGNSICLPLVFVNSENTLQNKKGENQYSIIDNSSMANSILVSKSSCNITLSTFSTPKISRRSEEHKRGRPTLGNKQIFSTSGLEGYRVRSGISEQLPILLLTQRDKVHQLISASPGKNEIAGASMPYKLCSRLSCMFVGKGV